MAFWRGGQGRRLHQSAFGTNQFAQDLKAFRVEKVKAVYLQTHIPNLEGKRFIEKKCFWLMKSWETSRASRLVTSMLTRFSQVEENGSSQSGKKYPFSKWKTQIRENAERFFLCLSSQTRKKKLLLQAGASSMTIYYALKRGTNAYCQLGNFSYAAGKLLKFKPYFFFWDLQPLLMCIHMVCNVTLVLLPISGMWSSWIGWRTWDSRNWVSPSFCFTPFWGVLSSLKNILQLLVRPPPSTGEEFSGLF